MKVVVFGATGMVGQGVLLECLDAPDVERVVAVVRSPTGRSHPKLEELLHSDFTDFSSAASAFAGCDACFFCLGVSSAGLSEPDYRRITYDFTVAAGKVLAQASPGMVMCFVSGQSTDDTGKGPVMWARVKGQAENALAELPFKALHRFRPGFIQPVRGVGSKTPLYRLLYTFLSPLFPLVRTLGKDQVVTTAQVGQAMLETVRRSLPSSVVTPRDINALAPLVAA